ncbi:MAG: DUF3568 family protein [Candidatus Omnitrophica bacterium]|nr:DUF3568 family protein [Candidatus Omnitrophota bacterium]
MKKILTAILGMLTLCCLCGCSALLIGATTAGSVGMGVDTIRLERFVEYSAAWNAALATMEEMNAQIATENQLSGIIEAEVDGAKITINIRQMKDRPASIDVTARKKGFPSLSLADKIVEDINGRLSKKTLPE